MPIRIVTETTTIWMYSIYIYYVRHDDEPILDWMISQPSSFTHTNLGAKMFIFLS